MCSCACCQIYLSVDVACLSWIVVKFVVRAQRVEEDSQLCGVSGLIRRI